MIINSLVMFFVVSVNTVDAGVAVNAVKPHAIEMCKAHTTLKWVSYRIITKHGVGLRFEFDCPDFKEGK